MPSLMLDCSIQLEGTVDSGAAVDILSVDSAASWGGNWQHERKLCGC